MQSKIHWGFHVEVPKRVFAVGQLVDGRASRKVNNDIKAWEEKWGVTWKPNNSNSKKDGSEDGEADDYQ